MGEVIQQFLPLIITSIPIMFICHSLAKEKGKDVALWTILGIIPGINIYSLFYLIGVPSNILKEKTDKILHILENQQDNLKTKKNKEENMFEVEEEI